MTKSGVGVAVIHDELLLVELELGVGEHVGLLVLLLVAAGPGTASTIVVVTLAVTVGPALLTCTVFVVCSTIVVASAPVSVEAAPPTLTTL